MVRRNFSLRRLSRLFGTNPQYIRDAMAIREKDPKFLEAIKTGEVTIPQAKKMLNTKFSITVAFDPSQRSETSGTPGKGPARVQSSVRKGNSQGGNGRKRDSIGNTDGLAKISQA